MASISSSASSLDYERPNQEFMRALVASINGYIFEVLANDLSWNSLKSKCTSKLNITPQEFFEFSEQSVLSNLYWGIESIEAAVQAKSQEERSTRLSNSERMLQVPALLDENGVTAGIQNHCLVCYSYFYLSMVSKLRNDELQVALHFLQATTMFPLVVQTELAPELCSALFPTMSEMDTMSGKRCASDKHLKHYNEANISEAIRETARRYKHWLMYCQVVLDGQIPQWHRRSKESLRCIDESHDFMHVSTSSHDSTLVERGHWNPAFNKYEKMHSLDPEEYMVNHTTKNPKRFLETEDNQECSKSMRTDQVSNAKLQGEKFKKCKSIRCIQDMLMESQSETPTSTSSCENYFNKEGDSEDEVDGVKSPHFFSGKPLSSLSSIDLSILDQRQKSKAPWDNIEYNSDEVSSLSYQAEAMDQLQVTSRPTRNRKLTLMDHYNGATGKQHHLLRQRSFNEVSMHSRNDSTTELMTILQKAISKLCFSEELEKFEEDSTVEVTTIYKILNDKRGIQYTMLKEVILDQLLAALSNSKEEKVIRASVSILATIVSVNRSAAEDIKKKGLQLCDLATALKRNVHEAATLIYLINPSPTEIKTLGLLPALVEVVCTSNNYVGKPIPTLLTPPAASLMMIEVLITAFDNTTNNMHLATINSPQVLSRLLDVARSSNVKEYISLANILIKCMQSDGKCRNYVSQTAPMAPFITLLQSNQKYARITVLKFLNEIIRIPRSAAISLLQRIRKEGSMNTKEMLMHCVQNLQADHQLLAANLLFQLETLETSSAKKVFREKAIQVISKSLSSEDNPNSQQLSAFILAHMGGTYSWEGEPYTVAWLVKKAGLTSLYHRNTIKNFDWLDQTLQDTGTDPWCSRVAKALIEGGKTVFHALSKGLKSNTKKVCIDSLTAIACIGCEIAKCPYNIRRAASEILLTGVEQFLHPGMELEERLMACLCIYSYAFGGKGMQKVIRFSEGVRESLRRFSSVTWMAEELHRVADYYLPNKSRVSCVHTQIVEASHSNGGAVTALIYYRGLLFGGYSDGSIKVWDIKHQTSTLIWDMKEHKKTVTCFSLSEAGETILSGSADKTIRVWQIQQTLECIEVIVTKEPIRKIETCGQMIFVITQSYGMKVFDSSRAVKEIFKAKKVKCMVVVQGKVYVGCTDSSIQELTIASNREREMKAPIKSWMQNKPINSIVIYKDWLYCASSSVEGSKLKEWRTNSKPQMYKATEKGRSVIAMDVVEDFIYSNCSSSPSTLQIWLRGTQQKVGRISAGSRITSLLSANDIVLCGTEKGLIKGWIPL